MLKSYTKILAAAALFLGAPAAAEAAGDCYSPTGCVEDAKSAKSLRDSFGVNTHLVYSPTIYYQNWTLTRDRLKELGVSHVRDGTLGANWGWEIGPTVAARYKELDSLGIKGNLLVGHEQDAPNSETPTTLQGRLDWIVNNGLSPFVIGIEGSNEYQTYGDPARIQSLRDMQSDIWQRVKNDPQLSSKLVIGPSSGNFYSDDIWYNEIGDLSSVLQRGNLHSYPGEDPPHMRLSRDLQTAFDWGRTTYGSHPYWATESGYWNKSPDGSHVSETASGIYIPRMIMEYFRRGVERTQLYELFDLSATSNQVIDNYGLLRADGTKKLAFTNLANMMSILKDTTSATGSLGFSVKCNSSCHSPIRHTLVRHSNGAYYLALWSESNVWDKANGTDTPRANQQITLNLHNAPGRVDIYNTASTTPFKTLTDGSKTISTQATDGVRLFKITPGTSSTAPTYVGGWESETDAANTVAGDFGYRVYTVVSDVNSSSGKYLNLQWYGSMTKTVTTAKPVTRVDVLARGKQCTGSTPQLGLEVNDQIIGTKTVSTVAPGWTNYSFSIPATTSPKVKVKYPNHYESGGCKQELHLDYTALYG